MAELKRNFLGARMNKDVDERLLKPGEYRDANNIEISTSEGSDAGTVQTIKGNTKRSTTASTGAYSIPDTATCVGSIAALNTDKVYYLVSAGDTNVAPASTAPSVKKDYIMEYDPVLEKHKYVFVDIYKVNTTCTFTSEEGFTLSNKYLHVSSEDFQGDVVNSTGIRIGMKLTSAGSAQVNEDVVVTDIKYEPVTFENVTTQRWRVILNRAPTDSALSSGDALVFDAPERVLQFDKTRLITGINILDDSIYWTDGYSEPKKINISRSIAGTGGTAYLNGAANGGFDEVGVAPNSSIFLGDRDLFHTRLVKGEGTNLSVVTKSSGKKAVWVEEKHVTVIKKGPTQPLELKLYTSVAPRFKDNTEEENPLFGFIPALDLFPESQGGSSVAAGDVLDAVTFDGIKDFHIDDILRLTPSEGADSFTASDNYSLRIQILEDESGNTPSENPNVLQQTFRAIVLSIRGDITPDQTRFKAVIEQSDSLFEFKFPRFSYRYKYQDGEYSTFAPWSEIAFLADAFNFSASQGYNLGMVNQLRSLLIKGYHAGEYRMMEDVVEIDILYKETNNPTVYTVKTITPDNPNNEWPVLGDLDGSHASRGSIKLDTDLIHTVVPSNQLLRPWDNVPRTALAQEISANRLIYGNYLQNYNVERQPVVQVGYEPTPTSNESNIISPSVKTLRDYTLGVVFSDGYGRETPVLQGSDNPGVKIPKEAAIRKNRLKVSLASDTAIPDWARYFSYYIKEPSVEYYNLIMDRWYNAQDGNLWLSFPSSERNKVDEETFLVLKKANGSNVAAGGTSSYKIIAIENSAPDYVKSIRKEIGSLFDDTGAIGNSEEGYPIEDRGIFTIQAPQLEQVLGAGFNESSVPNLTVRFSGNSLRSQYYSVSKVSQINQDTGGKYHFYIEGKFGSDVGFATNYTGDEANRIDNLTVDFYSTEVQNKPEFDGRFFVKVNKDADLEKYILGASTVQDFVVTQSWAFRYINNNGYDYWNKDTTLGGLMPDDPKTVLYSGGGIAAQNRHLHPTEWDYHHNNTGDGASAYYWGGGTSASDYTADPGTSQVQIDPIAALNDSTYASQYWTNLASKRDFFIDGSTAYSWTSFNDSDPNGDGNGNPLPDGGFMGSNNYFEQPTQNNGDDVTYHWPDWIVQYPSSSAIFYNSLYALAPETAELFDAVDNWYNDWAMGFSSNDGVAANMEKDKGLPSRAIRDTVFSDPDTGDSENASYMDFSWTGIGSIGANPYSLGEGNIPHQIKDVVDGPSNIEYYNYTSASEFAKKLVTPGTRFRFQRDPDNTIYTVRDYSNTSEGYNNNEFWKNGSDKFTGAFGIRNYRPAVDQLQVSPRYQYSAENMRQRWSIVVTPRIGSGLPNGYNPITGTKPGDAANNGPVYGSSDYKRALHHDGSDNDVIEIIDVYNSDGSNFTPSGAVFETQPKESVELDIYYQASGLIPLELNDKTNEEYLPLGTTFDMQYTDAESGSLITRTHTITEWTDKETIKFTPALLNSVQAFGFSVLSAGHRITFTKGNSYSLTANIRDSISTTNGVFEVNSVEQEAAIDTLRLHGIKGGLPAYTLHSQKHYLNWNNCWTFGNGVESDRVRDDYNAPQMDNGVKASSTLDVQVKEEHRKHGLIWSGVYNSTSGINETNQFIMAESITKDLNPVYGSIQKLYNRDTRLIMLCEDKILRADTNKDLLFNADGNSQVVASNKVIGSAHAYQGDFGISTNPESFVATPYQMYFTDAMRGQVLRMTTEGVVSISDKGTRAYFADIMAKNVWKTLGTYDERKKEYNLSILKKSGQSQIGYDSDTATISYCEMSKGWSSLKSFIPQNGLSISNKYFTFYNGHIWEHYTNDLHNNFYGAQYTSDITTVINDEPGSIKSFGAINYEGSQAKVSAFTEKDSVSMLNGVYATNSGVTLTDDVYDGEYFNLVESKGWYVDNITTDKQKSGNIEFKEKEGKWFGFPNGETTTLDNLDEKEFTVQGLGTAAMSFGDPTSTGQITITVENNTSITYDPTGDGVWDQTIDQ